MTIDWNKPVQTRDGRRVKIFTTEARDTEYPVQGEILEPHKWEQHIWTEDGYFLNTRKVTDDDLVNVPEERWEVYACGEWISSHTPSHTLVIVPEGTTHFIVRAYDQFEFYRKVVE